MEPVEPHVDHYFGCAIVAGDYLGSFKTIPGQQFVVAAREATVSGQLAAGQAYSFVPAGGP